MKMSNKLQRQLARVAHLVFGSMIGFLVYAPLYLTEGLQLVMQVGVFPILIISGLWMWYGPRIIKRLKGQKSVSQVD